MTKVDKYGIWELSIMKDHVADKMRATKVGSKEENKLLKTMFKIDKRIEKLEIQRWLSR